MLKEAFVADSFAFVLVSNILGAATAARIPMINTTTTNSTKLNARRAFETLDRKAIIL
jgi:hypothetical protein